MKKFLLTLSLISACSFPVFGKTLRWSADTEGGAPNVFYEKGDISKLVGFEKEIIEKIAEIIGVKPEFHQNDWNSLIPGLERNLYDVVINGVSEDEIQTGNVLLSKPYFASNFALIIRKDNSKIKSILDCNDMAVGVLRCSKSEEMLIRNLKSVKTIKCHDEYFAFLDLQNGRIDAIFLDGHIAKYYLKQFSNIKIVDEVGDIKYSIILRKNDQMLKTQIDMAIDKMKQKGDLNRLVEKWDIKNDNYENMICYTPENQKITAESSIFGNAQDSGGQDFKYANVVLFFAKAAGLTLLISMLAMCVAIIFGLGLAIMRMYTPKWISFFVVLVIEFLRGTPLLIQLFFVFYGLPHIKIILHPFAAGVLTLGINYAAYEAENFRAGMLAVPTGQMEAARALGMNQWQALRHVILPQAFTFLLPPLTNDFISLLKDSSLVSLITIVELTKAYMIFATNSSDFFCTGAIIALIYFLLGFPFVRLARWAEYHLMLEKRAYFARKNANK